MIGSLQHTHFDEHVTSTIYPEQLPKTYLSPLVSISSRTFALTHSRTHAHIMITTMIIVIFPLFFFTQLGNTEEYIDGALAGNLGEVLIRCNNVLYVRSAEDVS